jgi:hypothetical protein
MYTRHTAPVKTLQVTVYQACTFTKPISGRPNGFVKERRPCLLQPPYEAVKNEKDTEVDLYLVPATNFILWILRSKDFRKLPNAIYRHEWSLVYE